METCRLDAVAPRGLARRAGGAAGGKAGPRVTGWAPGDRAGPGRQGGPRAPGQAVAVRYTDHRLDETNAATNNPRYDSLPNSLTTQ